MNINDIITESQHKCPHCGGPVFEYSELGEGKKDACYYKVKASAKVWPSAYASGRLVQCRKKGSANYGNKSEGVAEGSVTKKPQPYNEPNWTKKLPKEKLDAIAGPSYKKDKKEQDVAEGSDPTRKVFFKVIKTQGTGMPSGYRRVKTIQPLEDGGFYIELSTPGYGMDYTRHNYKNFSLKDDQGKPITGYEANRIINGEQGVAEGAEEAEKYRAQLLKTAPRVMDFLAKAVKGWRPSEQEMLGAIDTAYTVMKHTGDVKQAGKAMVDELNTLHRMSQGQSGMTENFANGRNPQDKGDSKRHGINTKASVSSLRKTAKRSSGRKQELAHWMANMKAGRAKNEDIADGADGADPGILFYAKLPDGPKVYARPKDAEQLADLQQKYRGAEIKTFDYNRPDVIKWLQARGVKLRSFWLGTVLIMSGVMEAAHTANFNDDDWYEIDPDTKSIVSQRGPQAYHMPFGQRQIDLPNGNMVVRGMRAKGMGLDTGLDKPQQKEDGTWGAL